MLTRELPAQEHIVHNSVFSLAGRYLKGAVTKLRCPTCHGRGVQKCSKCQGKGMVIGSDVAAGGVAVVFMEPCRRCIGKGKEDCRTCAAVECSSSIATA